MNKRNIAPALRYNLHDYFRAAGIFYVIIAVITVVIIATFLLQKQPAGSDYSIIMFSMAATITVFVFGICSVRDDLRLCLQHGVGRISAFWAELVASVLVCLALAVACELLLALTQFATQNYDNIFVGDIYQLVFLREQTGALSVSQHLAGILFSFPLLLVAHSCGMFFSLLFFRLNKRWTVIVAIGLPVFFLIGLPYLSTIPAISHVLGPVVIKSLDFIFSGVGQWSLCLFLAALILTFLNWLLIRRTPIKAAKA